MIKKLIILVLVILIIVSLGIIGYLIYKQNHPNSLTMTPVSQPSLPNPFPIAESNQLASTTGLITTSSSSIMLTEEEVPAVTSNKLSLNQLSVVGLATIPWGKNTKTVFVDRGSGNLYSLDGQNNLFRQTNTTITEVGEVIWGNDLKNWQLILRQVKDGQIIDRLGQLKISSSSVMSDLKLNDWPYNPLVIAVSPDKQRLAYLTTTTNLNSDLYLSDWSFKKTKKIWSSPLADWDIAWPSSNLVTIINRPTFDQPGSLYFLDLTTNQEKRILNNINGLSAKTSPDGQKIIFSKSLLSSFNLYFHDKNTGTSSLSELNTLPDKCTWSDKEILYCAIPKSIPTGRYPDDWYLGRISFADDLWKIDLKQKTTTQIAKLKGNYDLINLTANEQTGWLYAINKVDNTLQAFSLRPETF